MLTLFRPDHVSFAFTPPGQATCSDGVTAPSPDCTADLWPQFNRTMLRLYGRTLPSNLHLPMCQDVDSQGSPDATSYSGSSFSHLIQELPNMNRHQYTSEPLVRISPAPEDMMCDKGSHGQSDSPAQQPCICNRTSDQNSTVSASAIRAGSVQTPLSTSTKQHGEELSRVLRDLHMGDVINTLPYATARNYVRKQNPVLKRIRLRRVSKKNSLKSRKSINE